jgi:hypothetical protein
MVSVVDDAVTSVTGWHTPAEHVPPRHPCPHAPQFPLSELSLTHAPLQLVSPDAHPHTPLVHTSFVPQGVVLGAFPVLSQTADPLAHDVCPTKHGFPLGLQAVPAVHATHAPLSHTSLVPHAAPFAIGLPVSVHVACPPEQETVPSWHAFEVGVQPAPFVHAWQTPLSQ